KSALELLWLMGKIVVVDRIGFTRVYDLMDRAVPSKYLDKSVDAEEVWRYFLQRAVDCLAVASITDVLGYFSFSVYALDKGRSRKGTIKEKVQVLEREDIIAEIDVEGSMNPHYIYRDNLALLEKVRNGEPLESHAWFLSPFDNVVWNRERVRRLFNADVRLEAYVPKAKRQFGYFVMPIIWNNQIIGRLDPKVDRREHTLTLVNFELTLPKEEWGDALDAIREELAAFMSFHECEQLVINRCKPAGLKNLLK
ncbi:MAG: winged helix DNA-binding domain-containing protein, partial [Candidatus Bathyarchaeota archaeon]